MAVTLFQSALQKLTVDQPFYDHLIYNLLLSYSLLIDKLLKKGDTAMALDFLNAALRLEIQGEMAADFKFLRSFAGGFQSLGVVFLNNRLSETNLLCCRKAISIYRARILRQSHKFAGDNRSPSQTLNFTTEITPDERSTPFYRVRTEGASTFLKNLQ